MTDQDNETFVVTAERVAAVLLPGGDLYPSRQHGAKRQIRRPVELRAMLPADEDGPALELVATLSESEAETGEIDRAAPPLPQLLLALRLAAACLVLARPLATARIHLHDDDETIVDETMVAATAMPWLRETLRPLRRQEAARRQWRRTRDAAIAAMPFPMGAYLPDQQAMAQESWRAFCNGNMALCEAPTGSGKSMAVLFGAVKALGQGHVNRLMFATARGTGRLAPLLALSKMNGAGLRLRTIVVGAKSTVCAMPGVACPDCPLGKDYYLRLPGAVEAAWNDTDVLGIDELSQLAGRHGLCPFELSLDLGVSADFLIGDYNYLFAPGVALQRLFVQGAVGLVIDEAHNLVDRVRAILSPTFDPAIIRQCADRITDEAARQPYDAVYDVVTELLATAMPDGRLETQQLGPLRPALRQLIAALPAAPPAYDTSARDLRDAAVLALACFDGLDETHAALALPAELGGSGERLKLLCVDPGQHAGAVLAKAKGGVLFSATLSPPDHFRAVLGLGEGTVCRRFRGPQRPDALRVLINDRLDIRYRHRAATAGPLATLLATFVEEQPGNVLLYFPSYAYLHHVAPLLRERLPEIEIFEQPRDGGPEGHSDFLARLAKPGPPRNIGMLVMGGVFAESIELPEGVLSGLGIVSVGLPAVSPEREALRTHYDRRGGPNRGFDLAYVYPGMRRVLQAAGRLIRRDGDRGCILLVDTRFTSHPYTDILPSGWNASTVSFDSMRSFLRSFWSRKDDE